MREKFGQIGLQVRTGLHTGECELIGDDVGGIAVHIGSRVSAEAALAKCWFPQLSKTSWRARDCASRIRG